MPHRNCAGTFAGTPHTRLFGTDGDKLHSRHQLLWSGFGPIPACHPKPHSSKLIERIAAGIPLRVRLAGNARF